MTEETREASAALQGPALALPDQFVAPMPDEAGELRMIRRSQWETLKRCVDRVKPDSSPGASWTSFLGGISVTGIISLITVRYTIATHSKPYSSAQSFLFWLTIMALLTTILMWRMEEREKKSRKGHIDALKEEVDAIDKYIAKPKSQI